MAEDAVDQLLPCFLSRLSSVSFGLFCGCMCSAGSETVPAALGPCAVCSPCEGLQPVAAGPLKNATPQALG